MRIVITGNIGCGKSTVVKMISDYLPRDYDFFDFDAEVSTLYQSARVQRVLVEMFGTCDKGKVSDIVHGNLQAMVKLRSVLDPILLAVLNLAGCQKQVILDVPLFFELREYTRFKPDCIICVSCSPEIQIERIKQRNGFSEEKIAQILSNQISQAEKEQMSDHVIYNSFSRDDLHSTVKHLVDHVILQKAC